MKNLIQDIKTKLDISGGVYIDAEIEDYIKDIDQNQYLEFFKALSGKHDYAKPMDRLANVAKRFSNSKKDELFMGTRELAKAMYNKFYNESCTMLDYCTEHRDRIPNDRAFFESVNLKTITRGNETVFTKQELYALNELGGGTWLMDIRCLPNSEVAINKIENIIKRAIEIKHLNSVAIENRDVRKLVGNIK